jgi:hypothetical protein
VFEFGLASLVDLLDRQLNVEMRLKNPVTVTIADVPHVYAGRPCTRYEVYYDRAHALRYAASMVVYVDNESKLPIRVEAYDTPANGTPGESDLIESFSYSSLKFNQGLGDDLFIK